MFSLGKYQGEFGVPVNFGELPAHIAVFLLGYGLAVAKKHQHLDLSG